MDVVEVRANKDLQKRAYHAYSELGGEKAFQRFRLFGSRKPWQVVAVQKFKIELYVTYSTENLVFHLAFGGWGWQCLGGILYLRRCKRTASFWTWDGLLCSGRSVNHLITRPTNHGYWYQTMTLTLTYLACT